MRRSKLVMIACGSMVVLAVGALVLTGPTTPVQAARVETTASDGSGPLDGLTFVSELGPAGKPADITDNLVFDNGMFVSTECERRCSYPASPYFVRQEGERLEFISETRCPHKDATIVWRGTVENGTIRGESTWTTSRWYWSVQSKFHFEGRLADKAG